MKKEVTIQFDNAKASEPQKAVLDGDFSGGGSVWDDMVVSVDGQFNPVDAIKVYVNNSSEPNEQFLYIDRKSCSDDYFYEQYFGFSHNCIEFNITDDEVDGSWFEESSSNIELGVYYNDNQYRSTISLNDVGMQLKTECYDDYDNKVTGEIVMDKEGPCITMSGDFNSDKGITLVLAPTDANGKSYEYEFQQYGIVYRIRDAHGNIINETNVFGNDQE